MSEPAADNVVQLPVRFNTETGEVLDHCPTCEMERAAAEKYKEQRDRLEEQLRQKDEDLENVEKALRAERRAKKLAMQDRDAKRKADPHWTTARDLFEFWAKKTHPDTWRQLVFGPSRQAALLSRLRELDGKVENPPRYIAEAIMGAVVEPYVDRRGKTFNELELICRNEVKLQDFRDRYRLWREKQG